MHARFRSLLVACTALLPSTLVAQGVVVQSTSDIRFYGALGTMAGIAARVGGMNPRDMQSTTSIAGAKMKVESGQNATVIDAGGGRYTHIDHKQKTYTTMTFGEMATAMERAVKSGQQNTQKAKAEQAKDPDAPKGEVKFKYSVAVDRTGERQKIAGYDSERLLLTITIEAEATPEGEKTEQVGSLVLLLDEWMSKDAPQIAATEEFQRAYAQKIGQVYRPPMDALQTAFNTDPRLKVGFEAAGKEMQKVEGLALRSTTYAVVVPAGMTFDRQAALGATPAAEPKKEEKKGGGFRGLMGAIKSAAEEASKQQAPEKNAPQQPKQATLLSVNDEVKSITRGAVPADTFEVPAGYREIKPTMP